MKQVRAFLLAVSFLAAAEAARADIVKSWTAVEAERDASIAPYSGGHALWLPGLPGGSNFVWEGVGTFDEIDSPSDGLDGMVDEARLHGIVVSESAPGRRWMVDMWFSPTTVGSGGPKLELYDHAYVPPFGNGGPIDPDTWRFFNLDEARSELVGLGDNAGTTYSLTQLPAGGVHPFQMGTGASGKNGNNGMSGWFESPGVTNGHWDVNIDLVPAPGAALLGMAGLGMIGWVRRRAS